MNFGEIFSKSWKTIWKHKILWVFGIFAAMLSGGGSGSSNASSRGSDINYEFSNGEWNRMFPRFGYNIERFVENINEGAWVGLAIALGCLVLIWVVLSLFLGNVGKAALIKGTVQVDEDETTRLKFGPLFREGLKYFWKLLLMQLLPIAVALIVTLPLILLAVFFSIITLGIGLVLLICLIIPVAVAINLLLRQTDIFIVAEDMDIFDALKASWKFVFEENLGNYLLMALIVGVGSWFLTMLLALPIFIVLIPVTAGLILSEGAMMGAGLIIGIIIFFIIYLPIAILANGILTAFVQAVWTLTYRELRFMPKETDLTPLELQSSLPDAGDME